MASVKLFNKGFNFSQDGPGNRLIYHFQGCNMSCGWCANPEGMSRDGELMVERKWLGAEVCPHGAIAGQNIDRQKCGSCKERACIVNHRSKGIALSYEQYDTSFILEEIKSCLPMFYNGGGVTFSGGEPTLQFAALEELLQGSKNAGVNTAIESNATHPDLDKLFPYLDQIILDFKLADEAQHIRYTGVSNRRIKDNLKKAFQSGKPVLVRIPVINHVNARQEDILEIIQFAVSSAPRNAAFELLPYHEYGKVKWEKCGKRYAVEDGFVSRERIIEFEKLFCDNNLVIKRT